MANAKEKSVAGNQEDVILQTNRNEIAAGNTQAGVQTNNSAASGYLLSSIRSTYAVINSNDSGAGSLRQAIIDANINPGDDTIVFQNGLDTITLTSGELLITSNITIIGTPSSLVTVTRSTSAGTANFRIFNIQAGATVSISNLTISGGSLQQTSSGNIFGAGISNGGTLSIYNSIITNNIISGNAEGANGFGGGIYNIGTLTLTASFIKLNSLQFIDASGGRAWGGGICNFRNMTITDTEVTENEAHTGTTSMSAGETKGGGIFTSTPTNIIRSSINNNHISGDNVLGGGISGTGILSTSGIVNISNSTISNNSATFSSRGFGKGGGIEGAGDINNSTISYNSIITTRLEPSPGGGGINGTFNFRNSIIANNTNSAPNYTASPDVFGTMNFMGNNLLGDSRGFMGQATGTDLFDVNARLAPLGNYGGLTQTVALLPNSPAINAGNNANAPATDQRGFARIVGGIIDIGAFEGDLSCVFTINPIEQFVGHSGGTVNVNVAGATACSRTAVSNVSWISVTSGSSGNGNGTVTLSVQANTGSARSGTVTIAGQTLTVNQASAITVRHTLFDFDGDDKADISVFRPSDGIWHLLNSNTGFSATQFGISTDRIVPADFDGDGKTDIAVYRDGTWYLLRSSLGFTAIQFGLSADIPVPADFDGDGKAELVVYRPSNGVWYVFNLVNSAFSSVQFGIAEDKPTIGDFDGDGKFDIAVYRPSNGYWYRLNSSNGQFTAVQLGSAEDKPTPADFDGDGKTDIAVFRPSDGTWYRLNSSNNQFVAVQFGIEEDKPVAADYDGDGRADIAVYRPSSGIWYLLNSMTGFTAQQFGISEDKSAPNAFVR